MSEAVVTTQKRYSTQERFSKRTRRKSEVVKQLATATRDLFNIGEEASTMPTSPISGDRGTRRQARPSVIVNIQRLQWTSGFACGCFSACVTAPAECPGPQNILVVNTMMSGGDVFEGQILEDRSDASRGSSTPSCSDIEEIWCVWRISSSSAYGSFRALETLPSC
jgi:hypothetical protein